MSEENELWFVLHCPDDDSHVLVDAASVIYGDAVKVGDKVKVAFAKQKKLVEGVVKGYSSDYDKMSKRMKELNTSTKPKRESSFHDDKPRKAAVRCQQTFSDVHGKRKAVKDNSGKKCQKVKERGSSSDHSSQKTASTSKVLPKRRKIYSSSSDEEDTKNHQSSTILLKKSDDGKSANIDLQDDDENNSQSSDMELTAEDLAVLKKLALKKKCGDFKELSTLFSEIKSTKHSANTACEKSEPVELKFKSNPIESLTKPLNSIINQENGSSKKSVSTKVLNSSFADDEVHPSNYSPAHASESNDDNEPQGPSTDTVITTDERFSTGLFLNISQDGEKAKLDNKKPDEKNAGGKSSNPSLVDSEDEGEQKCKKATKSRRKHGNIETVFSKFEGEHFLRKATDEKVVKLSPNHDVYVKEKSLKKIKSSSSSSCTALSRTLLKLVFTKEAMEICSVSGKPSINRAKGVKEVRTALHPEGIEAILDFVKSRALKKSLPEPNNVHLKQAMANALSEFRATVRHGEELDNNDSS